MKNILNIEINIVSGGEGSCICDANILMQYSGESSGDYSSESAGDYLVSNSRECMHKCCSDRETKYLETFHYTDYSTNITETHFCPSHLILCNIGNIEIDILSGK